ncbi:carbohydrate esterase family 4 protein [Hebeloma cylindrosporum]|uniref:chitin deacetylase n=1 Tax=Hebeloma cylindrosporum TaxID=76867 RepID=A0A0C2Y2F2_HEBCY|nr:carbohydrate esterase family 4 protein [Hebeloma cylindrosporum h7]
MLKAILAIGVAAISLSGVDGQGTPDRMTEKGESSIKDPNLECQPYLYEPVASALASFPGIWSGATIVDGDTNALAKWAAIQPNVPDIPPKGTLQGNFDGLNYGSDDPDCWWTNTKCVKPKASGIPEDIWIMPEPRTLGYGFDDGPNCSHNAFYDYLASQNQKATMFFIGSNVMDWPLETQRAVADGHEVCIHGWSHQYMTAFQNEDAFAELYYSAYFFDGPFPIIKRPKPYGIIGMQAIKLGAGVTPTCWRPPFGDVDDRIRAIANGLGLRTMLWQYDSQDWQVGVTPDITSESVDHEYQLMIDDAKKGMFNTAGTIMLFHELDDYTMSEAMKWYPKLKESFDHILPVGVGYNVTQPYVEDSITQPNFIQYTSGTGSTLLRNSSNTSPGSTVTTGSTTPGGITEVRLDDTVKKTGDAARLGLGWNGGASVVAALLLGLAFIFFGLSAH